MMVLMEQFIVYLALVLAGACFGSFAGATVWRLRARQLVTDKKNKEPYDKKELKRLERLTKTTALKDRSSCLHCGYELKWYDLIPVVSWLSLKGKCRSCKHPIGRFELIIELSMIAYFVLSYMLWPGGITNGLELTHFLLWLAAGVAMAILCAYDAKWFLLPDSAVLTLAAIGVGIVGVSAAQTQDLGGTLLAALGAVAVLGGLYAGLFALSQGRWVGFGDVKLGVALGLLLVDWQLALVALFLANVIGCLVVIPALATKKLQRSSHVPFGPMLITGAIIAWFAGWRLLEWYLATLGM